MKRTITKFAAAIAITVAVASGTASAGASTGNASLALCNGALAASGEQGKGSAKAYLQLAARAAREGGRRWGNCRNVCDVTHARNLQIAHSYSRPHRIRWAVRRAQEIHVNCVRNCRRRGY